MECTLCKRMCPLFVLHSLKVIIDAKGVNVTRRSQSPGTPRGERPCFLSDAIEGNTYIVKFN